MPAADATVLTREPSGGPLAPILLPDGSIVDLRPMDAAHADALLRFHHGLSSETTYLRFFTVHPELSGEEVDRFTHVDHHDREAIVATVDDEIVAVARFDRVDGTLDAEAAFVVADPWQGHGLGTELFSRLAHQARAVGIRRFVAEVLPHNRRMLNVFHHAGLPVSSCFRDGVVHLVIDLDGGQR